LVDATKEQLIEVLEHWKIPIPQQWDTAKFKKLVWTMCDMRRKRNLKNESELAANNEGYYLRRPLIPYIIHCIIHCLNGN
jgi:hypothetical protein